MDSTLQNILLFNWLESDQRISVSHMSSELTHPSKHERRNFRFIQRPHCAVGTLLKTSDIIPYLMQSSMTLEPVLTCKFLPICETTFDIFKDPRFKNIFTYISKIFFLRKWQIQNSHSAAVLFHLYPQCFPQNSKQLHHVSS